MRVFVSELAHNMLGFEGGVYLGAIEADDDFAIDVEHGDAGLLRFVECLGHVLSALLDILVGVLDAEFVEIFLCGMAKSTPRCAVNSNFRIHSSSIARRIWLGVLSVGPPICILTFVAGAAGPRRLTPHFSLTGVVLNVVTSFGRM